MRFAHISDLHLQQGPDADKTAGTRFQRIAEAIAADLERIAGILDFIVHTGDMTDDAHPDSFAEFERIFSNLEPRLFTIPGNHDGPGAYFEQARHGFLARTNLAGRIIDLGGLRLLGLNTNIEGRTEGALDEEGLELARIELAREQATPLVIAMHHPPFQLGLDEFDEIARLEGSAKLARMVQAASQPPLILSGHVHRMYHAHWHNASCHVAGSPPLPFTSQHPFGSTPIHPSENEFRYLVHELHETGSHVVTPQPFRLQRSCFQ